MNGSRATRERISTEALDWFLKLQGAARPEIYGKALTEWLLQSPAHIEEYLAISCTFGALSVHTEGPWSTESLIEAAREEGESSTANVVRLHDYGAPHPGPPANRLERHRPPKLSWAALAATLLLVAGLWVGYSNWRAAATFATAIGEQRSMTLQDGTVVFLNTNSKIQVRWTSAERHIDLIRGEARFQVARNPTQPFIVDTAKASVRVVGTIFNVRADPLGTQVAVMEGQVDVTDLAPVPQPAPAEQQVAAESPADAQARRASWRVRLASGERAVVTGRGIETNEGPPLERVEAWTERRLVFHNEALGEIVSEFNRYRAQPLVLDDPQLAALKMSGAFDMSDPESLVTYLQAFEMVQVERTRDGSEHLSRGAPAAGRK